jgi:sarcosine oxidase, subunit gamma
MSYDCDVQVLPPAGLLALRLSDTAHDATANVLGFPLPKAPHTTRAGEDLLALWFGPDEWLLRMPDGTETAYATRLRGALLGQHAAVTTVSDAYIVLEICGPDACELLCQGTGIDVHPSSFATGRCARTRFARTRVALYVAAAGRSYHLFVPRSYAGHMIKWLERARGRS